jgi:hypothetical protein
MTTEPVNIAKLLKTMGRFEKALGDLYTIFSKIFPRYEGFWAGLAQEEKVHSKWIHTVTQGMKSLKQDGIEKVFQGHTTIEEVRSVC